jgi:hypothetical protein
MWAAASGRCLSCEGEDVDWAGAAAELGEAVTDRLGGDLAGPAGGVGKLGAAREEGGER